MGNIKEGKKEYGRYSAEFKSEVSKLAELKLQSTGDKWARLLPLAE